MKHVKTYEIFGLFKSEADQYAQQVIDIIKKENLPIEDYTDKNWYSVYIDNVKYTFIFADEEFHTVLQIEHDGEVDKMIISSNFWGKIKGIVEKREKEETKKRIKEHKIKDKEKSKLPEGVPDLSDVGRAAKKYNL